MEFCNVCGLLSDDSREPLDLLLWLNFDMDLLGMLDLEIARDEAMSLCSLGSCAGIISVASTLALRGASASTNCSLDFVFLVVRSFFAFLSLFCRGLLLLLLGLFRPVRSSALLDLD